MQHTSQNSTWHGLALCKHSNMTHNSTCHDGTALLCAHCLPCAHMSHCPFIICAVWWLQHACWTLAARIM
jgi:hypothetical protein